MLYKSIYTCLLIFLLTADCVLLCISLCNSENRGENAMRQFVFLKIHC